MTHDIEAYADSKPTEATGLVINPESDSYRGLVDILVADTVQVTEYPVGVISIGIPKPRLATRVDYSTPNTTKEIDDERKRFVAARRARVQQVYDRRNRRFGPR